MLSEVTIYTSLESCAQCAGMMALGNVNAVVYLQTDPGMYLIGNILRKLSGDMPKAPRPINGSEVGLDKYSSALQTGFVSFAKGVKANPFWTPTGWEPGDPIEDVDDSPSITSYLATDDAWELFEQGAAELTSLVSGSDKLQFPNEQSIDRQGQAVKDSLTNSLVVENVERFLDYADKNGRRGTPHRV